MTQPPYPQSQPQFQMPAQPYPPAQQPAPKRSGWQNPWVWVAVLAVFVIGGALAGRGNDSSDTAETAAAAPTTVTVTATPSATEQSQPLVQSQPTPPPPPPVATTPTGVNFAMPAVVGMDLQSAQNLIQTNGVFLSVSHDLLGSRSQVLDSNWIVCTQNIPAGQQVTGDAEGAIDLGVVKREESCP